jgi:LacI family transcriptional regulator
VKKQITMKMIAEKANVSIGTVDRALNNRGRINQNTYNKVVKVASELGYKPNTFASILSKKKSLRITAVLPTSPSYFFEKIHHGMKDAQRELLEYKISVTYLHPKKLDALSQLDVLKDIDKENTDGIVMNPANAMITDSIDSYYDNGIPVVTFNSDVADSRRLFYIGPEMHLSGKIAGELLGKFIHGAGEIIVLEADARVQSIALRKKGFLDTITSDYPNIHVSGIYEYGDDDQTARDITKKVLSMQKNITGIFVNSAAGTVGVAKALEKINSDNRPVAVGFDAPDYVRDMLKQGVLSATVCQDPYLQGYYAIKLLAKNLLEGWMPDSEYIYTRQNIILKQNASEHESRVNLGLGF